MALQEEKSSFKHLEIHAGESDEVPRSHGQTIKARQKFGLNRRLSKIGSLQEAKKCHEMPTYINTYLQNI